MVKKSVLALGGILAVIGILGFVSGVTSADGMLLGFFAVNTMHNIVHLLTGIIAIAFAMRSEERAKFIAKVLGVVYAIIAVLGFVAEGVLSSLMMVNTADHVLHALVAVIFLVLGFALKGGSSPMMSSGPSMQQPTL